MFGTLTFRGTIAEGGAALMTGITGLEASVSDGWIDLYTATGGAGGVARLRVSGSGTADLTSSALFGSDFAPHFRGAMHLTGWQGEPRIVLGGDGGSGLLSYRLTASGGIGTAEVAGGLAAGMGRVTAAVTGAGGYLYLGGSGGGIGTYRIRQNGDLALKQTLIDPLDTYTDQVADMALVSLGGSDFLLALSRAEDGLASFAVAGDGTLALRDGMGAQKGLGMLSAPMALAVVGLGGKRYAIAATAADTGQSGALSVVRIEETGALTPTDHLLDSLFSRFGRVQDLAVLKTGGRVFVAAGGGDDGISLLELLPGGLLVHLDTVEDTLSAGLGSVSRLAMVRLGDRLHLFVAGQDDPGLAHVRVGLGNLGTVQKAAAAGDTLTGGDGDDLLFGQGGNDRLMGGPGDDILRDGRGEDTLTGGGGADLFVFHGIGRADRITDFNPADDRLDLSFLPMFYDPAQLKVTAKTWGAEITFGDRVITLHREGGGSLSAAQVRAAVHRGPDRPPLVTKRDLPGTDGAETLTGGWTDDFITGFGGADLLAGGGGADRLDGGSGADTIQAGSGADRVLGGTGRDRVWLGDGDDLFVDDAQGGRPGSDVVRGEAGQDTLNGAGGADTLHGGSGDDVVRGRAEADLLTGGSGDDRLSGGGGPDRLMGNDGRDTLSGDAGQDLLDGGGAGDVLGGGAGADTLRGQGGADRLAGGDGDDALAGGPGGDRLEGGSGEDGLSGGPGRDTLIGGVGRDRLEGGDDGDLLQGGGWSDTLRGQAGWDRLEGGGGDDVLAGGGGGDTLAGGGGADTLLGHAGADLLIGGDGADSADGGQGADVVRLGHGADLYAGSDSGPAPAGDVVSGDAGHDTLRAGAGADRLLGGPGRDVLAGGGGGDTLRGGGWSDTLLGQAGWDRLEGGDGNDALHGQDGRDWLSGGRGYDVLTGGAGADSFVFALRGGADRVRDHTSGEDTLVLDERLWGGGLSPDWAVVRAFATRTAEGVLFDFPTGDSLLLEGLGGRDGLGGDIAFL